MIKRIRIGIKKVFAEIALLSVELLVVLVLFLLAFIVFVLTARAIFIENKEEFDFRVFDFLSHYVTDTTSSIMKFITVLGTHYFLIPANLLLMGYFLFIKRHRWYSIKIPVIALSSTAITFILKFLFNRPRPLIPLFAEAKGLSFPSGHAMISFTFYGLLIYIVWQTVTKLWLKWTIATLLSLLIIMIGFSRIYLRVHYASDVIAGFCLGLVWLVISIWVLKRIEKYSRKEVDPVVEEDASLHAET